MPLLSVWQAARHRGLCPLRCTERNGPHDWRARRGNNLAVTEERLRRRPGMPRFDLAENATFPQLVERIIECSRSFEQMWPYFWIKAVAVRDGATWHLCHFYLVGRWSDGQPIRRKRDKVEGGAVALVSHLVTASEAWGMLATLAQEGTVSLLPDVVAMAPHVPISNIGCYWKEPVRDIPAGIADVIEQAPWRYLHIGYTQPWLANDFETQARLQRAIQRDLDQRNARS